MNYYKVYYQKNNKSEAEKQAGYQLKNGLIPVDPFHDYLLKDLSLIHLLFYEKDLCFTIITDKLNEMRASKEIVLESSKKGYTLSHIEAFDEPIALASKKLFTYTIYDFMCLNKGEKYNEFHEVLKTCNLLNANGSPKRWKTCEHPRMIQFVEEQIYQSICNRIRKFQDEPVVYLRVHKFEHDVKTLFPESKKRIIQRRSVFTLSFTCNWELNTDLNWGQEVAYGFGRLVLHMN